MLRDSHTAAAEQQCRELLGQIERVCESFLNWWFSLAQPSLPDRVWIDDERWARHEEKKISPPAKLCEMEFSSSSSPPIISTPILGSKLIHSNLLVWWRLAVVWNIIIVSMSREGVENEWNSISFRIEFSQRFFFLWRQSWRFYAGWGDGVETFSGNLAGAMEEKWCQVLFWNFVESLSFLTFSTQLEA